MCGCWPFSKAHYDNEDPPLVYRFGWDGQRYAVDINESRRGPLFRPLPLHIPLVKFTFYPFTKDWNEVSSAISSKPCIHQGDSSPGIWSLPLDLRVRYIRRNNHDLDIRKKETNVDFSLHIEPIKPTMKSPKTKSAANNTGPRQVRFKEDSGNPGTSFPVTQGTSTSTAPAFNTHEDDAGEGSGVFVHTSTNPSASVNLGSHFPLAPFGQAANPYLNPFIPSTSHPAYITETNSFAPFGKFNPYGLSAPPYVNMADYQNVAPPAGGLHFQPPVPDTTYGPMQHVYVPRFDNGMPPVYHVGLPHAQPPANNVTYIGQAPFQPPILMTQQPPMHAGMGMQAPVMLQAPPAGFRGPPMFQGPQMGMNIPPHMGGGGAPIFAGNANLPPDVTGFGKTAGEVAMEQAQFAYANGLFEPQDFKPADDDPSRYYPVREVDGNWTQRNRFTIDNLGDCRWYVTNEGYFYAVRLPN
ncbi:hypothetical protein CORC01_11924 [Colletotrichum orchidophilum]|uniref:Uncharacterized protein n=1 Tax=Colletotrichum orchidophilum TaxID=1209926 RepID=A0A1G4AUF0_9PEZI|nr:uncharacterized protein CORC01_11924 [Colletotrichum orchidophilum]OHE92774.1 hypothetical protein CORC01_11924 [Colletotrichum orchidophilum]